MQVKEGSLWWANNEKRFRVISVTEAAGHTWVHYREEPKKYFAKNESNEYSCYIESFVQRFSPIPE